MKYHNQHAQRQLRMALGFTALYQPRPLDAMCVSAAMERLFCMWPSHESHQYINRSGSSSFVQYSWFPSFCPRKLPFKIKSLPNIWCKSSFLSSNLPLGACLLLVILNGYRRSTIIGQHCYSRQVNLRKSPVD